jgi:hypothetical protein
MTVKCLLRRTGWFVFIITTILSCHGNREIRKTVAEWREREIKFPERLQCISLMKDTACVDLYSDNYKILLYADSLGCTDCRLRLPEWKRIINEQDTIISGNRPDFLFFFQPKSDGMKGLKLLLRNSHFDCPVFVDGENVIMELNNFPKEPAYQCFLLDRENKVVMVGNPVYNRAVWELYKKIINGNPL